MPAKDKIAILTGGGDVPGLNPVIKSVVYRATEGCSDLAVFEATDIARGPVALAHLSSRVPAGFHGNWRPGTLQR